jgi:ABC-2 type transport system permease protein
VTSLLELWTYRSLIWNLAQRELKSRYKKSILGWAWSLINPAATLLIFTVVFGTFLRVPPPLAGNGVTESFALYLFAGLVIWNFFNATVMGAIGALQSAGPLLNKVYFPPSSPGIANMFTVLIQTLIETVILLVVLAVVNNLAWTVVFFPLIVLFLMLFSLGLGLVLSVYNVFYRDVSHLTTIAMQVLFYGTPIIYTINLVPETMFGLPARAIIQANPLTQFVDASRQIFYLQEVPSLAEVGGLAVSSVLVFLVGFALFQRKAKSITEEL